MLSLRKIQAFTLIELITVITIILILMGLLIPAVGYIQEMAKKVQAKNDIANIATAVRGYYTDYGQYPTPTSGTAASYGAVSASGTDANSSLLAVLTGTDTTTNPRGIAFIELPPSKSGTSVKSGLDSAKNWHDPWGQTYGIAIDYAYSNTVQLPTGVVNACGSLSGSNTLNTGVAVWSMGNVKLSPTNSVVGTWQ